MDDSSCSPGRKENFKLKNYHLSTIIYPFFTGNFHMGKTDYL